MWPSSTPTTLRGEDSAKTERTPRATKANSPPPKAPKTEIGDRRFHSISISQHSVSQLVRIERGFTLTGICYSNVCPRVQLTKVLCWPNKLCERLIPHGPHFGRCGINDSHRVYLANRVFVFQMRKGGSMDNDDSEWRAAESGYPRSVGLLGCGREGS